MTAAAPTPRWTPADLVVHRAPMLLLDEIKEADSEKCIALVRVDPTAWYADAEGAMPGWFGIELMAQTVSAYSGHLKRCHGQEPRIGFLLGALRYDLPASAFPAGVQLEVEARLNFLEESGLSAFRCEIRQEGRCLACAMLKTFEPV